MLVGAAAAAVSIAVATNAIDIADSTIEDGDGRWILVAAGAAIFLVCLFSLLADLAAARRARTLEPVDDESPGPQPIQRSLAERLASRQPIGCGDRQLPAWTDHRHPAAGGAQRTAERRPSRVQPLRPGGNERPSQPGRWAVRRSSAESGNDRDPGTDLTPDAATQPAAGARSPSAPAPAPAVDPASRPEPVSPAMVFTDAGGAEPGRQQAHRSS